jgi:hypothetical protein
VPTSTLNFARARTHALWLRRAALTALVICLGSLGLAGNIACAPNKAAVLNVTNASVPSATGQPLSDADVRAIILRALADKHWTVASELPGSITANVLSRGHEATIRVDYTASSYSITHVSSSPGLKYDGTTIHRAYNNWIKFLNDTIQREATRGPVLVAVPVQAAPAPAAPEATAGGAEPPPAAPQ